MEKIKSFLSGCLRPEIPIRQLSGDEKTARYMSPEIMEKARPTHLNFSVIDIRLVIKVKKLL